MRKGKDWKLSDGFQMRSSHWCQPAKDSQIMSSFISYNWHWVVDYWLASAFYIPYSAKFLRVFSFANLQVFQWKLWHATHSSHAVTVSVSMDNIPELSWQICKELSPKRYLQSRHYFADSCELEQTTMWDTWQSTMPIVNSVCGVCVLQIYKNISIKSSKISICKNLDLRKFSAIQYIFDVLNSHDWPLSSIAFSCSIADIRERCYLHTFNNKLSGRSTSYYKILSEIYCKNIWLLQPYFSCVPVVRGCDVSWSFWNCCHSWEVCYISLFFQTTVQH